MGPCAGNQFLARGGAFAGLMAEGDRTLTWRERARRVREGEQDVAKSARCATPPPANA